MLQPDVGVKFRVPQVVVAAAAAAAAAVAAAGRINNRNQFMNQVLLPNATEAFFHVRAGVLH
jgi:hypothetical protein